MISNALQFTMREMQRILVDPRFWTIIVSASLLIGLVGPFGTYDQLRLAPRIAYWMAIAISTYLLGDATVAFLAALRSGDRRGGAVAYALYGAAAGLPIAGAVWLINLAVFGAPAIAFAPLAAYTVAISCIVACLIRLVAYGAGHKPAVAAPVQPQAATPSIAPTLPEAVRPAILDRLPLAMRGRLSHLSMQDHYVEVCTDKGCMLVLMRLADAIAETRGVEGLQIHRSHWVATDAVRNAIRRDGRLYLEMSEGTALPVSRTFLKAVRAAGLAS